MHKYILQPAKQTSPSITKNSTKQSSMKSHVVSLFIVLAAAAQWTILPTQGVRPDVFECDRVAMVVRECYTYLRGIDTKPSVSCCNGAKMIINLASKPDEQPFGCKCYKEAYSYFGNLKENAMLDISKKCNMNIAPLNGNICSRN